MCGVIGFAGDNPDVELLQRLFCESVIRGLHAFGAAYIQDNEIIVARAFRLDDIQLPAVSRLIAHTRYSTSGDWRNIQNNQPLHFYDRALVFNGVISMATKAENEALYCESYESDNDGEIFLKALWRGCDPVEFVRTMRGSFAGCWLDCRHLFALRNERRPLWRYEDSNGIYYASTRDIFRRAGIDDAQEVEPCQMEVA